MKKKLIMLICLCALLTNTAIVHAASLLDNQNITIESGKDYLDKYGHYRDLPVEEFSVQKDAQGIIRLGSNATNVLLNVEGLTMDTQVINNGDLVYLINNDKLTAITRNGLNPTTYVLPKTFSNYLFNNIGFYGYEYKDGELKITQFIFQDKKITMSKETNVKCKAYTVSRDKYLWALKDKSVLKISGLTTEEKYITTTTLDKLAVVDDANIVVWDENTVASTSKVYTENWKQRDDGTWNYYVHDAILVNHFANLDGHMYYFDDKGTMRTGWVKLKGDWYNFNSEGIMQQGWIKSNNNWYYLQEDGRMVKGWVKDNGSWYYMNSDGTMKKGWIKDGDKYYYLKENGTLATDTTVDGYVVDSDGAYSVN